MLEFINRCLRTLDFCHVGKRTEAGIFVHHKGRVNGEWEFLREFLQEKLMKNLIIGSVGDHTSAKLQHMP